VRDRRLKGPEAKYGIRQYNTSQAWYMYKKETSLVQAFVTEQYISRDWHSAIHRYRDSAQYKIHGDMK